MPSLLHCFIDSLKSSRTNHSLESAKKVKSIFKGPQPIHSCPPVTATLSKLRKHGGHVDSVLFCADHELHTLTRRDVRQSTNGRSLFHAYLLTVSSHGVGNVKRKVPVECRNGPHTRQAYN